MSTYYENLRHPHWQRRRLEIMQRDNFRCRKCGDSETTLNVHHAYYVKARKPWEYPDDALATLCEPCHESLEQAKREIGQQLADMPPEMVWAMLGFAKVLWLQKHSVAGDDTKTVALDSLGEKVGALCVSTMNNQELLDCCIEYLRRSEANGRWSLAGILGAAEKGSFVFELMSHADARKMMAQVGAECPRDNRP